MRELLAYFERQSRTVTIYDFTGSDAQFRELSLWLRGHGIDVRTAETTGETLDDVAVLHREGDVLGACVADALLSRLAFETAIESGDEPPLPEMLASLPSDVTVQPSQSVEEMVRVSREFERRALREGAGELHVGFQTLSQIRNSERTMEMYETLAEKGLDVRVYGYPDTTLDDVPFTVVADEDRELDQYWFLLYDGDDNPHRKAVLVSEDRTAETPDTDSSVADRESDGLSGVYDSFFTTDPGTVDDLFALARETYPRFFSR